MKKRIGIIGGAGPHAGALLYEKIISVCQQKFGYKKDADFPFMMLLNIPFSDMLDSPDGAQVTEELEEALSLLEKNGMERVAIACNTLHGFLPSREWDFEFVDLRSMIAETGDEVLILCTSTSSERGVYARLKKGIYLKSELQRELDALIDRILAGKVDLDESAWLSEIIMQSRVKRVLLGCTELSLLHARFVLNVPGRSVIDPLDLLAEFLCLEQEMGS